MWDKTPKKHDLWSCGTMQARNPERAIWLHLARSGSQSQRGILSSSVTKWWLLWYHTLKSFDGCLTFSAPPCDFPSVITMQVLATPCLGAPLKILPLTSFKATSVSVDPPVYFSSSILFLRPGREYRTESSNVRSINTLWSYLIKANLSWTQSTRQKWSVIWGTRFMQHTTKFLNVSYLFKIMGLRVALRLLLG